jgi:hypothetical protein
VPLLARVMKPTNPGYAVFLVLPQAGARLPSLQPKCAQLGETLAARLLGVGLYYRSVTDMAMLALQVDFRTAPATMGDMLTAAAADVGGALLDTSRMPNEARRRFYDSYLPLYDVAAGARDLSDAMRVLARHLAGASPLPCKVPIAASDSLEVRFRRGDGWQLARVRSVTFEGIAVATATPPRRGDVVDLELMCSGESVLVRSNVVGVTSNQAATALGASGFGARFLFSTEEERICLGVILRGAGGEKLRALSPPPKRREARYPVRWPVFLRSARSKASLRAIDMSSGGMFVAADEVPADGPLQVAFPIDDRGAPIVASARIARRVAPDVARARGLVAGFGLEILGLATPDEGRFQQFVDRIGRRAERDVVVGASNGRVEELTTALSAAGYSVSGCSGAPELVARAAAGARIPDLVVIDASLARANPRALSAARRALGVRQVPTLVIDGETPRVAREYVDGALLA